MVFVNQFVPELFERMANLWSWLPDEAWVDREAKAYVPARYAVCAHSGGYVGPADMSQVLVDLPGPARDFLAGAPQVRDVDPSGS